MVYKFHLRRAQIKQINMNLPLLERVVKINKSIADEKIYTAINYTFFNHPLGKMKINVLEKTQETVADEWNVNWNYIPNYSDFLNGYKDKILHSNDVVKTSDNGLIQVHEVSFNVVRSVFFTYIHISAPHTIIDGYGINSIENTLFSKFNNKDKKNDEIFEYSSFIDDEKEKQENPSAEAENYWIKNFSKIKEDDMPKLLDDFENKIRIVFSLSELEKLKLFRYFFKKKATITIGIIAIFSMCFSRVLKKNQVSFRMTDNQRRVGGRMKVGGYFAEDYMLFMFGVYNLSFDELLILAMDNYLLSLKYISSFRVFDEKFLCTPDMKCHYKVKSNKYENNIINSDYSKNMNMKVRINIISNGSGVIIEILLNNNYFSSESVKNIKESFSEKILSIIK